jgi:hypothetical protein
MWLPQEAALIKLSNRWDARQGFPYSQVSTAQWDGFFSRESLIEFKDLVMYAAADDFRGLQCRTDFKS